MSIKNDEKKIWLIRSAGKIIGPFTFETLKEKLITHQISLLDEVKTPDSRWDLVRNQKKLADVVEYIKEEISFQDEDTALISIDSNKMSPIDIQYTEIPEPEKLQKSSYVSVFLIKEIRKIFWIVALISIVVAAIFGFFQFKEDSSKKKKGSYNEQDFILGNFKQSLEKLNNIKNLNSEKILKLALLQTQQGNQPVESRRTLEGLDKTKMDFSSSDVDLIYGLSYMKERNWNEAQKVLERILEKNQNTSQAINAKINLAIIDFMKGQYDKTQLSIQQILKNEDDDPFLYLLEAAALFHSEAQLESKIKKHLIDSFEFLNKVQNYKVELLLYRAALQIKIKEIKESSETIDLLLETHPQLTSRHIQNLWIDQQVVTWENISETCNFITREQIKAQAQALKAFCSFQMGESGKALRLIETGRQQFGNDNLFISLQGFLLQELGQHEQVLTLEKMVNPLSSNLLNTVVGEICLNKGELTCAEKHFDKVLKKDPNDLNAITGFAKLNFILERTELAKKFVKTGLNLSPQFRPLMELEIKYK